MNLKTNWEWKKLSDVCDKPEYGYTTSASIKGNGPKLLRTTDITKEKLDWETVPYCAVNPDNEERYRLRDGDLLVSRAGSVGASIVIENPPRAVFASYLIRFRPKTELNPEFAGYFLKSNSFFVQLGEKTSGTTLPGVNATNLANVKIPIPPIPVQRHIASILEKAESAKQKRQEANRLTVKLLKSAFIEMFGDPISNTKKWEYRKLGEALDVRDGTHDTPKYVAEGIPLITSKNLKDGEIDFENIFYISQADYKQIIKRSFVETGDILYGMIGTIGSPVIVNTDIKFGIKNVALFKFRDRKVNNYYIKTLFEDDFLTKKLLSEKRGGNQKFVSLDILRNFNIPLPPFELQQEFAALVQKVDALKSKQQESAKELDNLFNSLMQRAFKGELSHN